MIKYWIIFRIKRTNRFKTDWLNIAKDNNISKTWIWKRLELYIFTVIDWFFVVKRQLIKIPAVFMTRKCVNLTTDFFLTESSIDNGLITKITKEEIPVSYKIVLCSFGISIKDEELIIPSLCSIPQLHVHHGKYRDIASSAKCFTKPRSQLLILFLQAVKSGFRITMTLSIRDVDFERCERSVVYIQLSSISSC